MPRARCGQCGGKLPPRSRFCPECGARVEASTGDTAVQELPPGETGRVPVDRLVTERRFFGVPPSTVIFGLGVAALALSILLFAIGHWIWGLVLVVLSVFLLAGFVSQTRRLPAEASGVARASVAALDSVRARAGAAVESLAAQGSARIDLVRLRKEAGELAAERGELLRELGEAVYEQNDAAATELKKRITELDERIQAKETEMTQVTAQARERIGRAQLAAQPTEIAPAEQPPNEPAEPNQPKE